MAISTLVDLIKLAGESPSLGGAGCVTEQVRCEPKEGRDEGRRVLDAALGGGGGGHGSLLLELELRPARECEGCEEDG